MGASLLENITTILKCLVLSCPEGMTMEKLNKDFKNTEGYWIPYEKLGYRNLESFLCSLKGTLVVNGYGKTARIGFVSNEKVQHIDQMISNQKNASRARRNIITRFSKSSNLDRKPVSKSFENHQLNYRQNSHQQINRNLDPKVYRSAGESLHRPDNKYLTPSTVSNGLIEKQRCDIENYSFENNQFNYRKNSHQQINGNLDPKVYRSAGESLQRPDNKYLTPSTVRNGLIEKQRCDIENYSFSKRSNAETKNFQTASHASIVKTTNKNHCEIVEQAKFRTLHNNENQVNYQRIKEVSYDEKSHNIKNPVTTEDVHDIEQFLLQTNFFKSTESISSNDDLNAAIPRFAANSLVFQVDFPEDTVKLGTKIKPYEIPEEWGKGYVTGIFISEVHNPYKFWFHIFKESHELDILMHRIERFYSKMDATDYCIPPTCISPGQICAAQFNKLWHRAEILTPAVNNKTTVYFVDYGTVSEVAISDIKYLATAFASANAQALRGSLSHIKPKRLHWEKDATDEFLSMVCNVMVYAQITEIDIESRVVHMVICDTNKDPPIQINKALVEKGLALLDDEWNEEKIRKNGVRVRHPRADFPTFEMIENGEYPSYSQLNGLSSAGIDYEHIIDRMIFHPGKLVSLDEKIEGLEDLKFPLLNTNPFKCDIIIELCRAQRSS